MVDGGEHLHLQRTSMKTVVLTVLLLTAAFTCFSTLLHDNISGLLGRAFALLKEEILLEPQPRGFFKLAQMHRHGAGRNYRAYQVLDVTEPFIQSAGEFFHMAQLQADNNSSRFGNEDFEWTNDPHFETSNPFDYEFKLKSNKISMKRLVNNNPDFMMAYLNISSNGTYEGDYNVEWFDDNSVIAPNISDKETIMSLALMSSNAYVRYPHTGDWRNVTMPWNHSVYPDIGWEDNGIRGHVFYNDVENIVVLSLKGTSAQGIPGSGEDETTANDKLNDNLLFSCCCARISYLWNTVCDCYKKSYTCDEICLEKELRREDRYYKAVLDIYKEVRNDYPYSTIWLTGHSLGGALSSLLGRTFGIPTVTFEAPGEYLASKRLHLPFPPGLPDYLEGIWHFGHTADPIFMGTCNGASSSCSIAGYAMETSCHSGRVCIYDVIKDKGWHVNMLNHRIHTVIDKVLSAYDEPAMCIEPEPCVDCYNWKFVRGDEEDKKTTVTSSKTTQLSKTTTKTSTLPQPSTTCIGRNWWGICTEYGPIPTLPTEL